MELSWRVSAGTGRSPKRHSASPSNPDERLTTTGVPPVVGPSTGITLSTDIVETNSNVPMTSGSAPDADIATSTVPGGCAGELQRRVESPALMPETGIPPNQHVNAASPINPEPEKRIALPPFESPDDGEKDVASQGSTYSKVTALVVSVPSRRAKGVTRAVD
jgi:hypothetical protein